MKNKINGIAKWIIVALAIGGLIFNSGILYNDVKHLSKEIVEIRKELQQIRICLMMEKEK